MSNFDKLLSASIGLGVVDVGRRGGMSLSKQVKALIKYLSREAQIRGNSRDFHTRNINMCFQNDIVHHTNYRVECILETRHRGSNL